MDFANERYVRLYVRDTVTWKRLGWDGQNALTQLLRKADRSGVIDLNGIEPWEAVVVLCGAPEDQARRGMARMLELEVVEHDQGRLLFPRYVEANECKQSDAQRQRESRARRGPISRNPPPTPVTKRDHIESQNVTECHGRSQDVTDGHSVPSRAVPSQAENSNQIATAETDISVRETPVQILASKGRQRLRAIDELQLDFDHAGKWQHALSVIAQLPAKEWAAAAAALKVEVDKGNRKFITPQSVVDNWRDWRVGEVPGQRKPVARSLPVEAPRYAYRDAVAAGGK